jgi:N-acetylneuraminic acid mutarotase
VYGAQGTAAAANIPGARYSGLTWVDASGKLWLFGGTGFDSTDTQGTLNDLWKFDPSLGSNGEWTWMGGGNTVGNFGGQPGVYGTQGKPDVANIPGGRYGISGWNSASGTIWLFGGGGYDSTGAQGYLNDLWQYQP